MVVLLSCLNNFCNSDTTSTSITLVTPNYCLTLWGKPKQDIMLVTFVHVWVKPGMADAFIKASTVNHISSVQEKGNLRFDLLRDANDENKFVLYEAYESEEAATAHKDTAHYKKWRETVADMMAQPRRGDKHKIVCPTDLTSW